MSQHDVSSMAHYPGLIWGYDFAGGEAHPIDETVLGSDAGSGAALRWLHFNLSDQRSLRWLAAALPEGAAALLATPDAQQTYLLDQDRLTLVLHDVEHDFHGGDPRIGALRVMIGPSLIVTARRHPVRSADVLNRRLRAGPPPADPADALELVFLALMEVFRDAAAELEAKVQDIEDELLTDRPAPDARHFITLRAVMVRVRRSFVGLRAVLRRLDEDAQVPRPYAVAAGRALARLEALEADLMAVQSQLRLLRDELDLQAAQQTNRTLYVLSVLTALLMPATLVTGIFGMNTGGLVWLNDRNGSIWATGLALGSAALAYLVLRLTGYLRR
jgi:Mg2+ and Co2+ transporter CorA